MSEIEEIKKKYPNECTCLKNEYGVQRLIGCSIHGIQVYKDIQFLLSSLEKEKEYTEAEMDLRIEEAGRANMAEIELKQANKLREIRDGQLEELKAELEKEKEQTDYFRLKVNKLTDELGKVKVIKDQLLRRRIELGKEVISLRFELAKEKERVRQLEKAIDEWAKLYHSLQEHTDKLGKIITEQTEKRLELEEEIKKGDLLERQLVFDAIDSEPEYPGTMPDELWQAVIMDKGILTEAMRATVRLIKKGIRDRIKVTVNGGEVRERLINNLILNFAHYRISLNTAIDRLVVAVLVVCGGYLFLKKKKRKTGNKQH